jgi:hypothetical protein
LTLGIAQAVSLSVVAAGGTPQSILTNGFGSIAFISVMPLIAVQTRGLIYDRKYKKAQQELALREVEYLAELLPEQFRRELLPESEVQDE